MSSKALVSARPWSAVDAREGLLQQASCAEVVVDGVRLRVLCEPLVAKGEDGISRRAVRLDAFGVDIDPGQVRLQSPDGGAVDFRVTEAPVGSVRLLVGLEPEQKLRLSVPHLGAAAIVDFVTDVVREWTVHVVHHSHLDIGYTDTQPRIQAEQRAFLDSALDLTRATDDWPEESRFRWAVESLWPLQQWLTLRPEEEIEDFFDRVRDGQIELTAMPYNLHTDTCSTDELHELLRPARELRDRFGVDFPVAMQTDVPGTVVGFADALAEVGVKYLSVAHNWAGRSMPLANGGEHLPRLFRWVTPSGHEVLVWMTDSPHGMAYMEGPFLGFHDHYDSVDRLLPAYLTSTVHNAYAYPPGVFGWHGDTVTSRKPYPWNVLHLRTQGFIGDNAPARLTAAEIIRRWNETWEYPKLEMSTTERFFADAQSRLGDQIETFEGDWGDWWVEGVGSAALPQSLVRRAQAMITDAQVVSQTARLIGGRGNDTEIAQSADAYASISLFNEHTWGASNSWLFGDEGVDAGEQQWHWKYAHALAAQERTEALLEKSGHVLASQLPTADGADLSVFVINTQATARTSTVRFLLREALVPRTATVEVRDARTGSLLDHVVEPQDNITHRDAGVWIKASVADVPGSGAVRLDVTVVEQDSGSSAFTPSVDSGLPGLEVEDLTVGRPLPDLPRSELLTLENEFLAVHYDERRSCISSVVDKSTGRELINPDAVVGFNGYVYDTYTTAGGYNHQSNKSEVGPKLELLGSRSLARPSVVLERTSDAGEERLVVEYAAEGVDRIETTLRLRSGEPVLHLENRLHKPTTMTKESAFFAFPFAFTDPRVRYEISGGVTGDGLEHIPGTPQHMRAIRDWVSLEQDQQAVSWVSADAPLVHPETIALPYAPFPDSTSPREPGTIFSWVHNNVWDTNFPVQQGFDATFRYAIGVDGGRGHSVEGMALATAAEVVHPLLGLVARGPKRADAPTGWGLLELSDDRVKVVSIRGAEDGRVQLRLQSFADEPLDLELGCGFEVAAATETSYLGDELAALDIHGRTVQLRLERLGVTAVSLTLPN